MKTWSHTGLFLVCLFCSLTQASYYMLINGQDVTTANAVVGETLTVSFGSTTTTPPGPDYWWGPGGMQVNSFDGLSDWNGSTVLAAAGLGAYTNEFGVPYLGSMGMVVPSPAASGIWFTGQLLLTNTGDMTLTLGYHLTSTTWITYDSVTIHVANGGPTLSVGPSHRSVGSYAITSSYRIANTGYGTMNWSALVIDGASWLSIQSGASGTNSGAIKVACTRNMSSSPRTGTIRISAPGSSGTPTDVTITQAAASYAGTLYGLVGFAENWLRTAGDPYFEAQYDHVPDGIINFKDFVFLAASWGQQDYFVSVDTGNDSNPGTLSKPFKTITAARNRVRTDIASGMTGDKRVYIRAGKYYQSNPITFNVTDSGRNGFNVIYRNYPDETPEIIGGTVVTGWQADTGNIYKKNLGTGVQIETLFENGQWARKARSPNTGYFSADAGTTGTTTLQYRSGDIPSFTPNHATVHVWPGSHTWQGTWNQNYNWIVNVFGLSSVNTATRILTLSQDTTYPMTVNNRYFIQGAKEFLDAPGEWYWNNQTGWLYYWPYNTPISGQTIVAGATKRTLQIQGNDIFNPVQNLSFRGLTFTMTNGSHEYKPWRGDDWEGMIYLNNADRVEFDSCRFSHSGTNIFYLGNRIQHCRITNNLLENFGLTGITGKGLYPGEYTGTFTAPEQAHIHKNNVISNNIIRDAGQVIGCGCGIWLYHSGDNAITHNLVENMPRLGIHFYGQSWQADLKGRTIYGIPVTWENRLQFNYSRNNYIGYNEMINCMSDSQDGGAYYTWGTGANNVVENNFVHDMTGLPDGALTGIYLDDASNFTTVNKNIVTRLTSALDIYPYICKGQSNVLTNNVSINNDSVATIFVMLTNIDPDPSKREPTIDNVLTKNISQESGLTHTLFLYQPEWQDSFIYDLIAGCDYNLWYHPGGAYNFYTDWMVNRTWTEWLGFGFEAHSLTGQNPLFTDPTHDNYTLPPGSPALNLGIESIDLIDVGLTGDFPY